MIPASPAGHKVGIALPLLLRAGRANKVDCGGIIRAKGKAMLSDRTVITHKIDGNEDITLWLVGDVHIGAAEFAEQRFLRDIEAIKADPNARVVLIGDIINNAVKSSVSNVYEERMMPNESKKYAAKCIEPIKDKILCAVGGNHEMRSVKEVDDDPAYDIMCKLDIENLYRQNAAFVKLQFGDVNGSGRFNPTYTLFVTHGSGGDSTIGGSANKQKKTQEVYEGIDIFIQGHTHKAVNFFPQRVVFDKHNNNIIFRTITCVTATSYLDYGGYAMRGGLQPFANVVSNIVLCGSKKNIVTRQMAEF